MIADPGRRLRSVGWRTPARASGQRPGRPTLEQRSHGPIIPDPRRIRSFRTAAAFETWLRKHHDTQPELWLKIFALAFRTNAMRTPAGRARKIAALVDMLARGETIVPERASPAARRR